MFEVLRSRQCFKFKDQIVLFRRTCEIILAAFSLFGNSKQHTITVFRKCGYCSNRYAKVKEYNMVVDVRHNY